MSLSQPAASSPGSVCAASWVIFSFSFFFLLLFSPFFFSFLTLFLSGSQPVVGRQPLLETISRADLCQPPRRSTAGLSCRPRQVYGSDASGSEWQCVGGLGLLQSHAVPTCAHALLEGPNPEGRSVSGRKGQHGGSCSVFFFGRGWGRKGSTRQSLPLDSLVWPAVSLAESPTHGSKLGMQIV